MLHIKLIGIANDVAFRDLAFNHDVQTPTRASGQDVWTMPEDPRADQGRGRRLARSLISTTIRGHITHLAPDFLPDGGEGFSHAGSLWRGKPSHLSGSGVHSPCCSSDENFQEPYSRMPKPE